jgi:hypothetical protein
MKYQILFWFTSEFTHFCLASSLQKKINCEISAISDVTKKTKAFFENQNFLDLKNYWNFSDNISTDKTDIDYDYLESFEKKYGINLWNLAVNERIFYRFFNFYEFSTEKICSIIENECKFFENVLDDVKPNFFISREPIRHHHYLMSLMCEKKNIPLLILSRTNLGTKVLLSQKPGIFDSNFKLSDVKESSCTLSELQDYLDKISISKSLKKYHKNQSNSFFNAGLKYLFSDTPDTKNNYYYFGRTKFKVLFETLRSSVNKKLRRSFINRYLVQNPELKSPFIYFPLHVDMERNLLISAPYYTNQIELIRHIVKSLPMGQKLFVKESPASVSRDWRKISDYKEIMKIPNVTLIHPSFPAKKLLENCSLVITVAGSSGFEAAFNNKPSIVFSEVGYENLSSVFRVENIENFHNVLKNALKKSVNINELDQFLKFMENNTIDFDWFDFEKKFNKEFYHDGYLFDIEIPIEKMAIFLNENSELIDSLALKHTEKIQWFNQNG